MTKPLVQGASHGPKQNLKSIKTCLLESGEGCWKDNPPLFELKAADIGFPRSTSKYQLSSTTEQA